MVPETKIKVVEKVKVVNKVEYVKQAVHGEIWEPAVYFGFDLSSLNASEQARLDRDMLVLKKNPSLKLSVQAFTDSKGSQAYNRQLALRRQQTVVDYFMDKGLSRDRILVSPLGEELPILGDTKAERVINRRVELMLLDASGRPLSLAVQPKATSFNAPFPVK
ncbi:OmpA family protein [Leucothrix pacifica]|uniref:OmpA family protein n=2 Tax=Leucothrix pacifica TaxID=1247513 RepID=A0A317CNU6_9GAMM|nr:OmpA family protein [Leucothrix pacifica]